jgi:multidomain signaling protein FimX
MQFDGEINLLVVNDNPDDANQLINLLRDVPHLVNPTIIEDKKELNQLFNQGSWNLAIIEYESQKLRARDFMSQMARHKLQIPTIIVASEIDSAVNIEGLRMGADYVVKMDEDQYFLLAVSAALGHYAKLQELAYWRKRYLESELRCEGLIDNSKDAIAIIQEGAFVYVNPGYSVTRIRMT